MPTTDFVAVGHICHDVALNGFVLGGAAGYSCITARNLGASPAAVTSFASDLNAADPLLRGIELATSPSAATTTFHNVYDERGHRKQTLLARADILTRASVPARWSDAAVVYLCPIADEVQADVLDAFDGGTIGATPQGWLRAWDSDGIVRHKRFENAESILPRLDVLVLSTEDIAPFPDELDRYRALTRRVIMTQGSSGATLYEGKKARTFPAYRAEEEDPTGAGDVFAAAFLIRFAQTRDARESIDFAHCVASFAVEGVGASAIPSIEQVEERRRRGHKADA